MIAEIKFKNMFSFRDETVLSFEADKSKDLESYHVVELAPDVKLLKLAVIDCQVQSTTFYQNLRS